MPGIRAAHIVRKDILKVDNSFNGKFSPECQKNSIPASLLSLVGMLIKGPTTKIDPSNNQACVTDPLKKNNLPTFSTPTKKAVSKDQAKVKLLKEDCCLFGWLYIACQTRDKNLDEFFSYENQPWPPPLSDQGQLRGGQKADFLKCLPQATSPVTTSPPVDAVILDGAVIVQMLEPKTSCTFDEYFSIVFAPYVLKQLENAKRADLVWDVYLDDSLKKSLREKRGAGQRRKVMGSPRIRSDWKGFLRVGGNKEELFKLLADKVCIDFGCLPALSILTISIVQQDMFTRKH